MAEEGQGRAPWWNIATASLVCAVAMGAGGAVLRQRPPSVWIAAALLLCAIAALVRAVARVRPELPSRGRGERDAESWRSALDLWSWREYPHMLWFVCGVLAQQELSRLYGFGWSLLVLSAALVPPLVRAVRVRHRRDRARTADATVV